MIKQVRERLRSRLSLWVLAIRQRVASIPSWAVVLVVAAVVGAVSAVAAVAGVARWNRRSAPALEVPSEAVSGVE